MLAFKGVHFLAIVMAASCLVRTAPAEARQSTFSWVARATPAAGAAAHLKKDKKKPHSRGKSGRGAHASADDADFADAPAAPAAPLPPPPPLPTRYKGVALLPIAAYAVDAELVSSLERSLLNEIDELPGLEGIASQDVVESLRPFNLSVEGCDRDLACLAQAGRYSRAQLAMEVRVSALGGVPTVSLRLIDTQAASELGRAAEPLAAEDGARAQQLHNLALQIITPETYVGALSVSCPTVGADVYLDDRPLGTTPLRAIGKLPAGLHVLRVSKAGYSDINRFVDVIYDRASTIAVDFNDNAIAGVIVEKVSATGFGELNIISNEPGLEVRIDGEPVGVTPLHGILTKVAAGKRHITLRKPGQPPIVQDLDIEANARLDAVLKVSGKGFSLTPYQTVPTDTPLPNAKDALAGVPPVPPLRYAEQPAERFTWRFWVGAGSLGAGAVSIATALVFGHDVKAFSAEAQAIVSDPNQDSWSLAVRAAKQARLASLNERGPKYETYELLGFGAGVVFVATGLGLVIWDLTRTELRPVLTPAAPTPAPLSLHLLPLWSPGAAGLSLQGRF